MRKWLWSRWHRQAAPAGLAGMRGGRIIRARYDAAITNDENRRHWANADGLSADAAASPEVRRLLRNRARPFMGPALRKELPRLPALWAGSVRS